MYPLRRNQDPAPRLHYCFLAAPPLSLHPLPSLISSCSNLPFGSQGRSWRLESIPYKQELGDGEFPGGPVVRIPGFHCQGPGSIPGRGTEIPQAMQHSQINK